MEIEEVTVADGEDAELESSSEAVFASVDTDGSGRISFEEFSTWWSQRAMATIGSVDGDLIVEIEEIWSTADADASGELNAEEFDDVLKLVASSDWAQAHDQSSNRHYFYNRVTKETRWHEPGNDDDITKFLEQHGVTVEPQPRGSRQVVAVVKLSSKLVTIKERLRRKGDAVKQSRSAGRSVRSARAENALREWQQSAEQWKDQAKTMHQDKIKGAAGCTGALTLLGLIFGIMWMTYEPPPQPPPEGVFDPSTGGIGETGKVGSLTHQWRTVFLNERYENPIIIVGVPPESLASASDAQHSFQDQTVARIKDIQYKCDGWEGWCFSVKLQEPSGQSCQADDIHTPGEDISWLAIDAGAYHLSGTQTAEDGSLLEEVQMSAGSIFAQNSQFFIVSPAPFLRAEPVVVTQVQTFNDPSFVKSRQRPAAGYSGGFFEVKLEGYTGGNAHGAEQIGYLAIEPSTGTLGGLAYEATVPASNINQVSHVLNFSSSFASTPHIFGSVCSFHGGNPAVLHTDIVTATGVALTIHGDSCNGNSGGHTQETVALFAIQNGPLYATRLPDLNKKCESNGKTYGFVDTGQFVSWSLARQAASNFAVGHPSVGSSHLVTITGESEQQCLVDVANLVRDRGEIGIGWIGGSDAEFNVEHYDLLSPHHGDALMSTEAVTGLGWELGGTNTPFSSDCMVTNNLIESTCSSYASQYTTEHCGIGPNAVEFLCDCGGRSKILGGLGKLGAGQYIKRTFALSEHTSLRVELDFLRIDSWDAGEKGMLWVDDILIWEQALHGGNQQQLCGRGWEDRVRHIDETFEHSAGTVTIKLNTTLGGHFLEEAWGIQNVIIATQTEAATWKWPVHPSDDWGYTKWHGSEDEDGIWVGKPDPADQNHFAAADWPTFLPADWQDCASDTVEAPPEWPRCVYGVRSIDPGPSTGPSVFLGTGTEFSHTTTNWPVTNVYSFSMVLVVVDHNVDETRWLSVLQVGNGEGGWSPGVFIIPGQRRLRVYAGTQNDLDFYCETGDIPQFGSTEPVHLVVSANGPTDDGQPPHHYKLAIFVNGELSHQVNGEPSGQCNTGLAYVNPFRKFTGTLFLGADPSYSGFNGTFQAVCLHDGSLESSAVAGVMADDLEHASSGAPGSILSQNEALNHAHRVFDLVIPFRQWDNTNPAFYQAVASVIIPNDALVWGYDSDNPTIPLTGPSSSFAVEFTIHVLRGHNNQWRNVFHMGRHVVMLHKHNLKLLVGVLDGTDVLAPSSISLTTGLGLHQSCFTESEVWLDEDVSLIYTYDAVANKVALALDGCSDISQSGCEGFVPRGCEVVLDQDAQNAIEGEAFGLILGDAPTHINGAHIPGFIGTISKFVLHNALLTHDEIMEIYSSMCGKHLHGYYIEYDHMPLHVATGGGGSGSLQEQDECPTWCVLAGAFSIFCFVFAVIGCVVLGFIYYESPPLFDLAPDGQLPTTMGFDMENEDVAKWLSKVPLLQHLTEQDRLLLADSLIVVDIPPRGAIITQGDPGDAMFFLENGVCEARKNGDVVQSYSPPDYFGELAMLNEQPRQASVSAGYQGCRVLRLERDEFNKYAHRCLPILEERRRSLYRGQDTPAIQDEQQQQQPPQRQQSGSGLANMRRLVGRVNVVNAITRPSKAQPPALPAARRAQRQQPADPISSHSQFISSFEQGVAPGASLAELQQAQATRAQQLSPTPAPRRRAAGGTAEGAGFTNPLAKSAAVDTFAL